MAPTTCSGAAAKATRRCSTRGLDTLARAFLCAAALHESGELERHVDERYAGWDGELGRRILAGAGLDALAAHVHGGGVSPAPRSGRQERLENLVNRFV